MNLLMSTTPDTNRPPSADRNAEVRRAGRLRCDMLNCTFGQVVDLSSKGMRVQHRGSLKIKVGEMTELTLSFASAEVSLQTRVVWMRRTGFRRHEIGFEFCDVSGQAQQYLLEIARCATKIATFRPQAA